MSKNIQSITTRPMVEFTWRAHPAAERTDRALLGAVIVLAIAAAIWVSFQSVGWSVFAVIVLVGSLNRFYFRSRFDIDAEGITARFPLVTRRFLWADTRRFVTDNDGGFLSTRSRRSWFDARRGMHILFGRQRSEVMEHIQAHLPEGAGSWAH